MMLPEEVRGHQFKAPKYKLPALTLRYRELDTAMEWGLIPSTWDKLEDNDRAEMLAFVSVKRAIEGYHIEKNTPEAEAEHRRGRHDASSR